MEAHVSPEFKNFRIVCKFDKLIGFSVWQVKWQAHRSFPLTTKSFHHMQSVKKKENIFIKNRQITAKTSPKGFSASKCDVGNWIFSKLGTFWEIVWKFFGFIKDFFGEFFEFFLEGFLRGIFWEDFLGGFFFEDFFGRIFWEDFQEDVNGMW